MLHLKVIKMNESSVFLFANREIDAIVNHFGSLLYILSFHSVPSMDVCVSSPDVGRSFVGYDHDPK